MLRPRGLRVSSARPMRLLSGTGTHPSSPCELDGKLKKNGNAKAFRRHKYKFLVSLGALEFQTTKKAPAINAEASFRNSGSPSWARTNDPRINSPLLYRLSYRGMQKTNYTGEIRPRQIFYQKRNKKAPATMLRLLLRILAPRVGLEPTTHGLTVRCSTD